jgi:hypothetical protein
MFFDAGCLFFVAAKVNGLVTVLSVADMSASTCRFVHLLEYVT